MLCHQHFHEGNIDREWPSTGCRFLQEATIDGMALDFDMPEVAVILSSCCVFSLLMSLNHKREWVNMTPESYGGWAVPDDSNDLTPSAFTQFSST